MQLDSEHGLLLVRDLRRAADGYPAAPAAPTTPLTGGPATERLVHALEAALYRLHDRENALAERLAQIAAGAETFIAAARDSDESLAQELERLV